MNPLPEMTAKRGKQQPGNIPGFKATETDILRQVRDYLRIRGFFVIRNQMGIGTHKGMTDLTAIREGEVWFIEIKTPKGKLSADQEQFRRDIEEHSGRWLVARSIEDIEALGERANPK